MLPFLSIIIAILAMVAMAITTKKQEKLYRFTSMAYGIKKHAIFEVRSTSFENAKAAGAEALVLYNENLKTQIKWEMIEELDAKTKQTTTILYKLPVETKVKETTNVSK
tara:strand:- start:74 stop:400 length:327 start_codon:yes stop_codon:yes gene_type:complete